MATHPRFARIAITLPASDLASADRLAKQQDRSRSWIVAEAIRRYAAELGEGGSPDNLGMSRRAQLRRDLALTPEARVREAEETHHRSEQLSDPQHFATFDDFLSWRRASNSSS